LKSNYAQHDNPFKTAFKKPGSGYNCGLSKYPEWKACPMRIVVRQRQKSNEGLGDDNPPGFKMTHKIKTKPTPSVALNPKNLKQSYPSLFR